MVILVSDGWQHRARHTATGSCRMGVAEPFTQPEGTGEGPLAETEAVGNVLSHFAADYFETLAGSWRISPGRVFGTVGTLPETMESPMLAKDPCQGRRRPSGIPYVCVPPWPTRPAEPLLRSQNPGGVSQT